MEFLKYLRAWYPKAVFLLNTRNIEDLIKSINNWKNLRERILNSPLPYPLTTLENWIQEHYERCRAEFKDDPNFIEVAIEDPKAPVKIGQALGVKLKWWGVENKNVRQ
jgi:hypothetical protein